MFFRDTLLAGGDHALAIYRFTNSGQPDVTFNSNGLVVLNVTPGNNGVNDYEDSYPPLFFTDHRINFLIFSETSGSWIRLNENGSFDAGFGTNGKLPIPGEYESAEAVINANNQTIIAQLNDQDGVITVSRLTIAGVLDNGFGTGGKVTINTNSFGSPALYLGGLLADGNEKIIISGENEANELLVIKLNGSGSLDNGFGTNGHFEFYAESDFGSPFYFFPAQLSSAGSLIFSGTDNLGFSAVLRLKSTGIPDASFGTNGLLTLPFFGASRVFYGASSANSAAVWLAGFEKQQNFYKYTISKRTANGAADISFGTAGFVTLNISASDAYGFSIFELPDNKLMLFGYTSQNGYAGATFVQVLTTGSIDNNFGNKGLLFLPGVSESPGEDSSSLTTIITHTIPGPGNTTLIAGYFENGGITDGAIFVSRLKENGNRDSSFGTNGFTAITPLMATFGAEFAPVKIATQADGKIMVASPVYDLFSGIVLMVQRITAGGIPENSFGTGGRRLISVGGTSNPFAPFEFLDMKVAPNDKTGILLAMENENTGEINTILFQLTAAGAADNSFSGDGKMNASFSARMFDYNSDNKMVLFGFKSTDAGGCCDGLAVMRLTTNGAADNSFNGGVARTIQYSPEYETPVHIENETDNAVTLLFNPFNSAKEYAIAKLNPSGATVAGWGTNGILAGDAADYGYWTLGTPLPGGGYLFASSGEETLKLLKVNASGAPDNSFGVNGIGTVFFPGIELFDLRGLVLQSGGKIIAAGNQQIFDENGFNSYKYCILTRLKISAGVSEIFTMINPGTWNNAANWLNGQIPPSVIPSGTEVIINPGGNGEAILNINVTVQQGGKITVKPGKKLNVASNLTVPGITNQ